MRIPTAYCRHYDTACASAWAVPERIDIPLSPTAKDGGADIAPRHLIRKQCFFPAPHYQRYST
jgi:hypothetical protein